MPCFEALFVLMPLMHSEEMMDVDLFMREITSVYNHVKGTGKRHSAIVLEKHLAIG